MPSIKRNEVTVTAKPTTDPLALEIQRLRAENEALKAQKSQEGNSALTLKVSENTGVICLYGLGQRPLSAYAFSKAGVFENSQAHRILKGFWGADVDYKKTVVYRFVMANEANIKRLMAAANARKAAASGTSDDAL